MMGVVDREAFEVGSDYRRVILLGQVVDWPTLAYRPAGLLPVCRFTVRTASDRWASSECVTYRIVAAGALGEWCKDYLGPGAGVRIVGRMSKRRRGETNIMADTVEAT